MTRMDSQFRAACGRSGLRFAVLDPGNGPVRRLAFRAIAALWTHGRWVSFAIVLLGFMAISLAHDAIPIGHRVEWDAIADSAHPWGALAIAVIVGFAAVFLLYLAVRAPIAARRVLLNLLRGSLVAKYVGEGATESLVANERVRPDWAALAAFAELAGLRPPSPVKCACRWREDAAWHVTVIAPPTTDARDPGGAFEKFRMFVFAALYRSARGELESITDAPVRTRFVFVSCWAATILLGFYLISGPLSPNLGRALTLVLPLALFMLAALDAGLVARLRGRVLAGPRTCIYERTVGKPITIAGDAGAIILLRDWSGSGSGFVLAHDTPTPRWIRFHLEVPSAIRQVPGLHGVSTPLAHLLGVWTQPHDLRVITEVAPSTDPGESGTAPPS